MNTACKIMGSMFVYVGAVKPIALWAIQLEIVSPKTNQIVILNLQYQETAASSFISAMINYIYKGSHMVYWFWFILCKNQGSIPAVVFCPFLSVYHHMYLYQGGHVYTPGRLLIGWLIYPQDYTNNEMDIHKTWMEDEDQKGQVQEFFLTLLNVEIKGIF